MAPFVLPFPLRQVTNDFGETSVFLRLLLVLLFVVFMCFRCCYARGGARPSGAAKAKDV